MIYNCVVESGAGWMPVGQTKAIFRVPMSMARMAMWRWSRLGVPGITTHRKAKVRDDAISVALEGAKWYISGTEKQSRKSLRKSANA
jgi:hypothetical protein